MLAPAETVTLIRLAQQEHLLPEKEIRPAHPARLFLVRMSQAPAVNRTERSVRLPAPAVIENPAIPASATARA